MQKKTCAASGSYTGSTLHVAHPAAGQKSDSGRHAEAATESAQKNSPDALRAPFFGGADIVKSQFPRLINM